MASEAAFRGGIDVERVVERPFLSLAILCLLAAPTLFYGIGSAEVCHIIEERVAVTSREMWRADEWIVPTMNGERRLQKPPLTYWLPQSLAVLRGSFDEVTLRLPFALAALASIFLTYGAGRLVGGGATGLLAGAILLSTPLFQRGAHLPTADIVLLLWVAGAWVFHLAARRRAEGGARPSWEPIAFYTCLGLGSLTKGPLVLPFTVLPLLVEAAMARSVSPLRPLGSPAGIALFILLSLLWPVLVELRLGGGGTGMSPVRQWVLESLGKVLPSEGAEEGYKYLKHPQPWHFYLARLLLAFGVWGMAVPFALWDAGRPLFGARSPSAPQPPAGPGLEADQAPRLLRALPLWFLVPLVFFSIVREKKIAYILPLMPLGALWVAATVERWYPAWRKALRTATGAFAWVAAALLALVVVWALFPSLLGRLPVWFGANALLAGVIEERKAGIVFLAGIALLGALLVKRLLLRERPLLPVLALVFVISLGSIPCRDIAIVLENRDGGVREECRNLAARIAPGQPVFATERLPSGVLFYLDRRIQFLGGDARRLETVPPGGALLLTADELKEQGGGGESLSGYSRVLVANPLEEEDRERVILFERLPR